MTDRERDIGTVIQVDFPRGNDHPAAGCAVGAFLIGVVLSTFALTVIGFVVTVRWLFR